MDETDLLIAQHKKETGGAIIPGDIDTDSLIAQHQAAMQVAGNPAETAQPVKQNWNQRVQSGIDQAAQESAQRQRQGMNPLLAGAAGMAKAAVVPLNETYADLIGAIPTKLKTAIGQTITDIVPASMIAAPGKIYNAMPESGKAIADIGTSALSVLPVGGAAKGTGAATTGTMKAVGTGLENLGKTTLKGELKITNPIARGAYGATLAEQKQNIVNDLVKFKLDSPVGNFKSMAEKAQSKASVNFDQADNIIKSISNGPDVPLNNPVSIARDALAGIPITAGKENQAVKIAQDIITGLERRGFNKNLTPDKLVEAKKILNADGKVFDNGPMVTDADNLDRTIRKNMYLALVDKIGEISPEVKQLNTDGKRLLDISDAASGAASRTSNHSALGLAALATGAGEFAHSGNTPEAVAMALLGAAAMKAAGQGRLSSAVIRSGQGIRTLGELMNKKLSVKMPAVNKTTVIANMMAK
jgi:hypothetical protein